MILKINTRESARKGGPVIVVNYFNGFEIELKHDSVASTFSFKFYFDPKNPDHAELAAVSHYHEAWLEHNGERIMTGYVLSNVFNNGSKKELTQIAGYSKPGVLEDCDIPTSQYPLETQGLTLEEIARKLIAPFGIGLVINSGIGNRMRSAFVDVGNPTVKEDGTFSDDPSSDPALTQYLGIGPKLEQKIKKTNAKESQRVKDYLTQLAAQRDVLLSHDAYGNLLFTDSNTSGKPLAHFEDGVIGTHLSLMFNGQGMHSHITVVKQPSADGVAEGEVTIRNPFVPILYRPQVIVQDSGTDATLELTAQQALAAELKNIILTIVTDRWEINGKIIRPNNTITVKSPDLYIYQKTTFFIQNVKLDGDAKRTIATLTCVLPEVYNKRYPRNIFVKAGHNLPDQL